MQKIFYEKEIDLLHQLKELVSLTVDESIDYKIEDHGVRAVGSLAIKGEYISQEKRHFLENVELDVYADDQKIIDRQDFHLKVEDFHYDIIDGNLKIKIEVGVYGKKVKIVIFNLMKILLMKLKNYQGMLRLKR